MSGFRLLIGAIGLVVACAVSAQWMWVEPDGRKVLSDRPPPAEIPDASILRRPGGKPATVRDAPAVDPRSSPGAGPAGSAAAPAATAASAAVAPARAASLPRPVGRDPELEERRRRAEAAEADKRKAEEERLAKRRADNCERARQALATLESGVRIVRNNAKGEREVMDDAARAAETARIKDIIDTDCKP